METYRILGQNIYYYHRRSIFSLRILSEDEISRIPFLPNSENFIKTYQPKSYTFCIELSDACNLSCDYCFNQNKTGRCIDGDKAIRYLEKMFSRYPNAEKYYVDLSGAGEPLLALKHIIKIAQWCKKKQDEIRSEVLPQFVCNGTLLTPEIVNVLQKNGILFGVSIDGDRTIHDRHRRYKHASRSTFDDILNNVKQIKNREYIGCAATLTKDVFPLLDAIDSLLPYFKTLSFRPARGSSSFDELAEKKWEREYDLLALQLLADLRDGISTRFFALLNGEDYFGRYLYRAFGGNRVFSRCDANITRFALDIEGREIPCPSSHEILNPEGDSVSYFTLESQIKMCSNCSFKPFCGGECPVLLAESNGIPNSILCDFRKHLILLAAFIFETAKISNPDFVETIARFCREKKNRNRRDSKLERLLLDRPDLTFTEAKALFDNLERRY